MLNHYITLNFDISASKQSIKKLDSTFGVIHVRVTHAHFKASSSTGMGGVGGDGWIDAHVMSRTIPN